MRKSRSLCCIDDMRNYAKCCFLGGCHEESHNFVVLSIVSVLQAETMAMAYKPEAGGSLSLAEVLELAKCEVGVEMPDKRMMKQAGIVPFLTPSRTCLATMTPLPNTALGAWN